MRVRDQDSGTGDGVPPEGDDPSGTRTHELTTRTARGARIVMLGQLMRIILQMVSVVVLARLLNPTDYGFFALALAVVALGEVFRDFGLSTAAVQAKTLSRGQQHNLIWINVALGCVLAGLCVILAPLLSAATGHSEASELVRVMAVSFVINGALAQYRADLNRRMEYRGLVVSDVAGQVIGVTLAIVSAVAGMGFWALAVQQIGGLVATLVITALFAGWLPGRPDRSADVRPMLRFGIGMVGTQLVGYANNNVDTLVIGLRFGPSDLGVYNRAYQILTQTLNQFRNPTTTVALPMLSRLQDGGPEADRVLVRGQAALGYTLVAGTAFAAGAAHPVIGLALGPEWSGAVPIFAALSVAGAFQTVGFVAYWVFISRGLTSKLFVYSMVSLAIRVVCVVGGSAWGVVGVAIGLAIAPAVSLPISYWMLGRWTVIPTRALSWGSVRIVSCAAVAAVATYGVQQVLGDQNLVVQLFGCLVGTVAAYTVLFFLFGAVRDDVMGVIRFCKMALGARRPAARHEPPQDA